MFFDSDSDDGAAGLFGRAGEGRYAAVLECRPDEILEVKTPGARSIHEEGFSASAFARGVSASAAESSDDDGDGGEDGGFVSADESGDEEAEADAVRRARETQHWDIPAARAFLSGLPARTAARCAHRLLPHIVRGWPAPQAADFLWEMAERDVLGFAVLCDARGADGVDSGLPFASVFDAEGGDAPVSPRLADAVARVAKREKLQSREVGRMLHACAAAWDVLPDARVLGPIAATLTTPLAPHRAAELLREAVAEDGELPEWSDELGDFFHVATKAWPQEKRSRLAEISASRWQWPERSACNAGLAAALSPSYVLKADASEASRMEDEGEEEASGASAAAAGHKAPSPKRSTGPPVPEPKPKRRMSAEGAAEPMVDEEESPAQPANRQQRRAAEMRAKRREEWRRQQQPHSGPMGDEDLGGSDEEFVSIDELSELFQAMGGGRAGFPPQPSAASDPSRHQQPKKKKKGGRGGGGGGGGRGRGGKKHGRR